jgi:hypothetical protein
MSKDIPPRLTVAITEEQRRGLLMLPHGTRVKLFGIIVDDVIRLYREHKEKFLAAVFARAAKLEDYSSLFRDEK